MQGNFSSFHHITTHRHHLDLKRNSGREKERERGKEESRREDREGEGEREGKRRPQWSQEGRKEREREGKRGKGRERGDLSGVKKGGKFFSDLIEMSEGVAIGDVVHKDISLRVFDVKIEHRSHLPLCFNHSFNQSFIHSFIQSFVCLLVFFFCQKC